MVGEPGYHLVVVPHTGTASYRRFETSEALVAELAVQFFSPFVIQVYAFGPDGRKYRTAMNPPRLCLPAGPVPLRAEPPVTDDLDIDGFTPQAPFALAAAPRPGRVDADDGDAGGGDAAEPFDADGDLDAEFD